MKKDAKIYIAGHQGLVGSAIYRRLHNEGFHNLVLKKHSQLDLRDQLAVQDFFDIERPEFVFLTAAKVGGIYANNTYRAEFIYDNLMIQTNVIHSAFTYGVKKLLFLGSSCIYPKFAVQPMREDALLSAALESTNEPYAVAKIAGIKMCQAYRQQYDANFICLMPTNLYGPNDTYDLQNSHVLPALIQKFYEAKTEGKKSVEIWGSGTPRREFLHVDDLADACLFLMEKYDSDEIINVGTGTDLSIKDLALLIKRCSGFDGDLYFNSKYPDGTPQKLLDISKIKSLGWRPKITLREGVQEVCSEYEKTRLYQGTELLAGHSGRH
ncbi:GDP-L-fucose synthase [Cytophagales bacterium WSM2-2]|nr:GDP-L-fucose synthase [Cytophagales bacterium WSM2-2]